MTPGAGASERTRQEVEIARRVVPGRLRYLIGLVLLLAVRPCLAWESWGGDPGGSRFSPLREITSDNVGQLVRAFEFHTGDIAARRAFRPCARPPMSANSSAPLEFHTGDIAARPPEVMRRTKFEATLLFVEDSLIFCAPFNEVIALGPGTGVQ